MTTKETKDHLLTCRGNRCYRTAVANCPGCGIPLCDECLKRHAKFPGKGVRDKHEKVSETHE